MCKTVLQSRPVSSNLIPFFPDHFSFFASPSFVRYSSLPSPLSRTFSIFLSHSDRFPSLLFPSLHPTKVNGQLSQTCYLRALDACYERLSEKKTKQKQATQHALSDKNTLVGNGQSNGNLSKAEGGTEPSPSPSPLVLADVDHVVCHSPYNKLVQKSFARMFFADSRRLKRAGKSLREEGAQKALERWLDVPAEVKYWLVTKRVLFLCGTRVLAHGQTSIRLLFAFLRIRNVLLG